MATTVVTAAKTIAPLESIHIDGPPESHPANHATAEPGIPLQAMDGSPELRHRTTQGRLSTNITENDDSSPGSAQPSTPSSTEEREQEIDDPKVSRIVRLLQCLPSWFPKGPFAEQVKREIERYNFKRGYNKFEYIRVDTFPEGYPQLAKFINSHDDFAVFRRFGELSARTLVQLQVDLTDLETELRELDNKDAVDPAMKNRLSGYEDFEGWNGDQRVLLSQIQAKLCGYFDLLLKDSQVRALGPAPARHHLGLFNWMWHHKPLGEDVDNFIFHVEDFVSIANRSAKGGRLADFVEAYLHYQPKSRIKSLLQTERELERTKDPNVDYYAPGHLAVLVKTLSVSLTVSLLLIPVFVLFLVPMSKEAMAWMVFGFVVAFSITISIMTEARAQELLIGSAAYAAVLVTFLGNMNQGTGFRTG